MSQIFINIFAQNLFIPSNTCQVMIGEGNLERSAANSVLREGPPQYLRQCHPTSHKQC